MIWSHHSRNHLILLGRDLLSDDVLVQPSLPMGLSGGTDA